MGIPEAPLPHRSWGSTARKASLREAKLPPSIGKNYAWATEPLSPSQRRKSAFFLHAIYSDVNRKDNPAQSENLASFSRKAQCSADHRSFGPSVQKRNFTGELLVDCPPRCPSLSHLFLTLCPLSHRFLCLFPPKMKRSRRKMLKTNPHSFRVSDLTSRTVGKAMCFYTFALAFLVLGLSHAFSWDRREDARSRPDADLRTKNEMFRNAAGK